MSCFNFGGGNCCWIIILLIIGSFFKDAKAYLKEHGDPGAKR